MTRRSELLRATVYAGAGFCNAAWLDVAVPGIWLAWFMGFLGLFWTGHMFWLLLELFDREEL